MLRSFGNVSADPTNISKTLGDLSVAAEISSDLTLSSKWMEKLAGYIPCL